MFSYRVYDQQAPSISVISDYNDHIERPSWVIYHSGVQALSQRKLKEALLLFRQAIALRSPYPEAETGIGIVHESEGLISLAKLQYLKVLQQKQFLYVSEDELMVRYRLARIYNFEGNNRQYEEMLLRITETDPLWADQKNRSTLLAMRQILLNEGFDRLALLYRNDKIATLDANVQLGRHYLLNGNYDRALDHLMLANLQLTGEIVRRLLEYDRTYLFRTVEDLILDVSALSEISEFIVDNDWHGTMYSLGVSLIGVSPISNSWSEILELLTRISNNKWAELARQKLDNPIVDPIIF